MSTPAADAPSRAARRAAKNAAAASGAWDRCLHYNPQKKRYCSQYRSAGSDFCGNHLPLAAASSSSAPAAPLATAAAGGKERIVCPVDPSHTLFARDLKRHVRVCNAARRAAATRALPCFSEGCNRGPPCPGDDAAIAAFHATFAPPADAAPAAAGAPPGQRRKRDGDSADVGGVVDAEEEDDDASSVASDGGDSDGADGGAATPGAGGAAATATANALHRLLTSPTAAFDLPAFAAKVAGWYARHVGGIPTEVVRTRTGDALVAAAAAQAAGASASTSGAAPSRRTLRHEAQQASLVGHMVQAGLLDGGSGGETAGTDSSSAEPPPATADATDELLLLEFGAGRGQLSRTVEAFAADAAAMAPEEGAPAGSATAAAAAPLTPSQRRRSYLLVDRGAVRRKADHLLGAASDGPSSSAPTAAAAPRSVRVRMDIADFSLPLHLGALSASAAPAPAPESAAAAVAQAPTVGITAYGKHLCGAATDLALRCLVSGLVEEGAATAAAPPPSAPRAAATLRGVAIATCCHHRCDWRHYVGRDFFTQSLAATPVEFEAMRMLSSWGVSGPPRPGQHQQQSAATAGEDVAASVGGNDGGIDRALLGRQCKRLIDAGRAWYLARSFGLAPGSGLLRQPHETAAGSTSDAAAAGGGGAGSVRLVHYCPPADSPENCLLLATAGR